MSAHINLLCMWCMYTNTITWVECECAAPNKETNSLIIRTMEQLNIQMCCSIYSVPPLPFQKYQTLFITKAEHLLVLAKL